MNPIKVLQPFDIWDKRVVVMAVCDQDGVVYLNSSNAGFEIKDFELPSPPAIHVYTSADFVHLRS